MGSQATRYDDVFHPRTDKRQISKLTEVLDRYRWQPVHLLGQRELQKDSQPLHLVGVDRVDHREPRSQQVPHRVE